VLNEHNTVFASKPSAPTKTKNAADVGIEPGTLAWESNAQP